MELPKVGDVIASKYVLEAVIGKGGFATVYRGNDRSVGRGVAIKILTPGEQGYALSVASRFTREARVLAGLTDEHTIRMFDFGRTDEGLLFMVFELLSGEDLADFMHRMGPLDEASVVRVVRQVLLSLREAHRAGLLHRDIKPANIRVYEYMGDPLRVKVMDFGIARWTGDDAPTITRTGVVVGTPRYMSPEQLVGGDMGPASDLYSVGLVAREMLTGDARTPFEDLAAGRDVTVPTPGPLKTVLDQMLRRDAADRLQSAEDAIAALDRMGRVAAIPAPVIPTQAEPPATIEDAPTAPPEAAAPAQPRPTTLKERPPPVSSPEPRWSRWPVALAAAAVLLVAIGVWIARRTPTPQPARPVRASGLQHLLATRPQAATDPRDAGTEDAKKAAADDGCGKSVSFAGEDRVSSTLIGLRKVSWVTYVPHGYDGARRLPLLFLFHPDGSSATDVMDFMEIRPFADARQFVIVAPVNREIVAWRDGVDPETARSMLEETRQKLCIDDERVFALGHGGGGGAAESMSCLPWIRAIATSTYRSNTTEFLCEPARPIPALHLAPMKSGHLPVEGGVTCGGYESVVSLDEQERMWRERNHCNATRQTTLRYKRSSCFTWDCQQPFVSCHIDGGHAWLGQARSLDVLKCDGPPADFPHLETIWDFFSAAVPG